MRLLLALLVSRALLSQSFEVATVKPSDPQSKGRWIRMQSLNQFTARNHALNTLIAAAYNVSPKAISGGPAWIDSDHYDIQARTPGTTRPTLDEQMAMLRQLLTDRFQAHFPQGAHPDRREEGSQAYLQHHFPGRHARRSPAAGLRPLVPGRNPTRPVCHHDRADCRPPACRPRPPRRR